MLPLPKAVAFMLLLVLFCRAEDEESKWTAAIQSNNATRIRELMSFPIQLLRHAVIKQRTLYQDIHTLDASFVENAEKNNLTAGDRSSLLHTMSNLSRHMDEVKPADPVEEAVMWINLRMNPTRTPNPKLQFSVKRARDQLQQYLTNVAGLKSGTSNALKLLGAGPAYEDNGVDINRLAVLFYREAGAVEATFGGSEDNIQSNPLLLGLEIMKLATVHPV